MSKHERNFEPHDHGQAHPWQSWIVGICLAAASAIALYAIVVTAP